MIITKSSLLKNSFIYVMNEVVKKIIPIVIIPILTMHLTKEAFGILGTYIAISNGVALLVGLGTNAAFSRHYWKINKDEINHYILDIYKIIFFSSTFMLIIFFLISGSLEKFLSISYTVLLFSIVSGIAQFLFTIYLLLLQLKSKALLYGVLTFIHVAASFGLGLLLLISYDWGINGYIIGYSLGLIILTIGTMLHILKKNNFLKSGNISYIKKILKYGLKYVLGAVALWIMNMGNRFILTNLVGIEETGIYTLAYSFGAILLIINTAVSRSWLPYFYKNIKDKKNYKKIIKTTYLYWFVLIITATIVSLISPLIFKYFISKNFSTAINFIPWIAFAYAINGMCKTLECYMHYKERPDIVSYIHVFLALISILLNYLLIINFNSIGAPISLFGTFALGFIIYFITVQKMIKMPWFIK